MFAPFWARSDQYQSFKSGISKVYYHIYDKSVSDHDQTSKILALASKHVERYGGERFASFTATWVLVVTWENLCPSVVYHYLYDGNPEMCRMVSINFFVEEKVCLTGQKKIVKSTSPVNSRVCLLALFCMFHAELTSKWELYFLVSRPVCIVTVLDWLTFTLIWISWQNSNNQRLEKYVWCVLLLYNWDVRVFFWMITYYRHGHNLVLSKFTINQLEIHFSLNSACLTLDRYQHDIESKRINPYKITAKAWNNLASAINTRGTS